MYDGIYLVFIRSLCIFVDILTVIRLFIFFNIKYEYNITLKVVWDQFNLEFQYQLIYKINYVHINIL